MMPDPFGEHAITFGKPFDLDQRQPWRAIIETSTSVGFVKPARKHLQPVHTVKPDLDPALADTPQPYELAEVSDPQLPALWVRGRSGIECVDADELGVGLTVH